MSRYRRAVPPVDQEGPPGMGDANHALRAARERMLSRLAPGEPFSRAELANAVNAWLWRETGRRYALDDHAVGRWERGQVRWPNAPYRAGLRAVLDVETDAALGFTRPGAPAPPHPGAGPGRTVATVTATQTDDASRFGDDDEMNRRELLRLFTMTGATLALPPLAIDTDRMGAVAAGGSAPDLASVEDFARLNAHLWQVYALTQQKKVILPVLREQLAVLCDSLGRAPSRQRPRICEILSELYQLTGEVFFDADRHADAAQCYLLASTAAKEANSHDLWAAALTRHSFVAVSGQKFDKAMPMLDLASGIADRGDPALVVRHWVAAVRAEVAAGTGDVHRCERDLDTAGGVVHSDRSVQTGGWLRFDGTRLPEQRGSCMVALGRLDAAETALTEALPQATTVRRRAGVTTDLASLSARRGDHQSAVMWMDQSIASARETASAFIANKLRDARPELSPLMRDAQIRRVDAEIIELGRTLHAGTTAT